MIHRINHIYIYGRPRDGEVFRCYKNVKKLYRQLSRQCIYAKNNELYQSLDHLLKRDTTRFWKSIKRSKKSYQHDQINTDDFKKHFSVIMQDNNELTDEQMKISRSVTDIYENLKDTVMTQIITPDHIEKCVKKLKRNSSPGIDGITGEFFIHGMSETLIGHLSAIYTNLLSFNYVPTVFNTGIMIPVLKKPTLNPSVPGNYRPIIVSSIFSKLFELLIYPGDVSLCNTQFGFRTGYGVYNGLTLLNDVMCYCQHTNTNMFLCSLDAEKCFDSIWHDGLFYKLHHVLPDIHWRFLRKWYGALDVVIKWNGHIHTNSYFKVTRGTRQGSIISPVLFNIFICDLLKQLNAHESGVRVGGKLFNSFAYADDISLFSTTVPGLQELINICVRYSSSWRFNFGINKTKCMPMSRGKKCFVTEPIWHLKNVPIETVSNLDILGVNFNCNAKYDNYVQTRIQKCTRSVYSLSNVGMCYPGLNTVSKVHLYKTICQPTLMYGSECLAINDKCVNGMQSAQGSIMKQVCGLGKRSHHSALLQALDIPHASTYINDNVKSLFTRVCSTDSPTRDVCIHFINLFITESLIVPGTLIARIVKMGISPTSLLQCNNKRSSQTKVNDGLVDSLSAILYNDNYIKPWSTEYLLVKLLTRSF